MFLNGQLSKAIWEINHKNKMCNEQIYYKQEHVYYSCMINGKYHTNKTNNINIYSDLAHHMKSMKLSTPIIGTYK